MRDPVFIIGCDRSGTTFLGDILGAADNTFTTPESHFFHDLFRLHCLNQLSDDDKFKKFLNENGRLKTWELNQDKVYDCYKRFYLKNLDLKLFFVNILTLYLETHKIADDLGELIWIDHTPDNTLMANNWKLIFPDCKFVHIVRDGRGVLTSLSKLPWGPSSPYFCSIFWSQRVMQGIYIERIYPSSCVTSKYEDIVISQESEIRNICEQTGIIYSPKILLGGSLKLPNFTKGQHAKVGKGISQNSLDKWRNDLTEKQIDEFENTSFTRDCLEYYGYSLMTESKPLRLIKLVPSMLIELKSFISSKIYFRKLNRPNND